ncbi:hypothetical protein [Clostridium sp. UBA7503]|uniref:hypothetical protein n=1 Tax=Clostridium sp. UBA7503 TaxID=1946377 RepID=UPI0032164002
MGLGCGNPLSISKLSPNEILLDLGSGGGFDCFLALKKVGPKEYEEKWGHNLKVGEYIMSSYIKAFK